MKKNKSVLKRQRLKKNKKKGSSNKFLIASAKILLLALVVGTAGYFINENLPKISSYLSNYRLNEISPEASVAITSTTASRLEEKEKVSAIKMVKAGIKRGQSMERIAKKIHTTLGFERVSVTATSSNSLVVYIKKREPYFAIEADQKRYVTKQGQVYGEVDETFKGPVLTGIFSKRSNSYKLAKDNSLVITSREKQRILQAITLNELAVTNALVFESIDYRDYRGFFVSLDKNFQNVAIGFPPFKRKFERLRTILATLKEKGVTSARIELDFEGKAFIKEVKM